MAFQYDLILNDSLENRDSRSRGSRARAVSNWVQWAQFEWLSAVKYLRQARQGITIPTV
jgi:hypothetical protein